MFTHCFPYSTDKLSGRFFSPLNAEEILPNGMPFSERFLPFTDMAMLLRVWLMFRLSQSSKVVSATSLGVPTGVVTLRETTLRGAALREMTFAFLV